MKTPRAAWLTTATLSLAIIAYSFAERDSALILLMLPVMIGIRVVSFYKKGQLAPPWIIALLTFATVAFAAFRVLPGGPKTEIFAEFVVFLSAIKSLERWSPRDDMQVLLIAIFLVISAAISSSALLIGILLAVFVPLLGFTAMTLQIEGAIAFGNLKDHRSQFEPPLRDRSAGSLAGIFTLSLVLVTGISIVAFMLLPRGIGGDTFEGFGRPEMGPSTGFRNSVELGRGGLISTDQTIVMEVEVREIPSDRSLGAAGKVQYLRGTALTLYDEGRWLENTDSNDGRNYDSREAGLRYDFPSRNIRPDVKQSIHLTPSASDSGILFSIWQPVRINFPEYHDGDIYAHTQNRTLRLQGSKLAITEYEVLSTRSPHRIPDRQQRRERDEFFASSDIVRTAAIDVLQAAGIDSDPRRRPVSQDYQAAEMIQDWLSTTGGFSYTLDIKDVENGQDPIEWFLSQAKEGHCEYFASAMAAMCRSAGVKSRVITGYVLGEYDTENERYIVRRSNAHAWVEVETSRGTWQTFDPTPNVTDLHVPNASQFRVLRRILDAVDGFWLTSIVSYNEGSQMQLFGLDRATDVGIDYEQGFFGSSKQIFRVGIAVVGAGLTGYLVFRWYSKPKKASSGATDISLPQSAMRARQRLLKYWKATGRTRPGWTGLVAHARGEPEIELASMLSRAAFGATGWTEQAETRSHQILRELEAIQRAGPQVREHPLSPDKSD